MLRKFDSSFSGFTILAAILAALISLGSRAIAQAPTLQEQLAAQYKLVKMGSDTSGYSVVDAGTLLAIQKGGVLGVPYADTSSIPATKYEGGVVHTPSALATKLGGFGMKRFGKEQTTHLFASGDKVYPTKFEVNVAKDTVTMGIVACDTCNKTDPPTYNKATVVFEFPKGSLANASAGSVEDTIGQLLAISSDDQQGQGGQQGGDQNQQQGGQQQNSQQDQQAAQAPAQQAEPQTIQLGQTIDQVVAALGKPDKDVKLGSKEIYVYKDLKVTFKDGKVSDVQ